MSLATVGTVLGLAVVDATRPATIGITIYLLLARPKRLGLLLTTYLGTLAAAYFTLGVLLMVGLGVLVPRIDPAVISWIQGSVGALMVLGCFFIPDGEPDPEPNRTQTFTLGAMVLLGLATWLFEFYTAIPYFAAIGIMTAADLNPAEWLSLLAVYGFIMTLPGFTIAGAWLLMPARMRRRIERWQSKLDSGSRATLRWMIGIAGVIVFLDALPGDILPF